MTKVAINGFGRIGRLAFRQMFEAEGYEVIAINLTSSSMTLHRVVSLASSVKASTLLKQQRTLSSLMVRKSLSTLSQMQLSFLGVSWALTLCSSALVSTLLRRRLLLTSRLVPRR